MPGSFKDFWSVLTHTKQRKIPLPNFDLKENNYSCTEIGQSRAGIQMNLMTLLYRKNMFSSWHGVSVNRTDDRVWRRVYGIFAGSCSLDDVWGGSWAGGLAITQDSWFSCSPAARATAATALLGGPGHRLRSAPLSAACLTDREGRERSNLYCGTVAKQQRRWKKKNIWWLYNYTVNTVPPPPAFFLLFFLFIPFLSPPPLLFFW